MRRGSLRAHGAVTPTTLRAGPCQARSLRLHAGERSGPLTRRCAGWLAQDTSEHDSWICTHPRAVSAAQQKSPTFLIFAAASLDPCLHANEKPYDDSFDLSLASVVTNITTAKPALRGGLLPPSPPAEKAPATIAQYRASNPQGSEHYEECIGAKKHLVRALPHTGPPRSNPSGK